MLIILVCLQKIRGVTIKKMKAQAKFMHGRRLLCIMQFVSQSSPDRVPFSFALRQFRSNAWFRSMLTSDDTSGGRPCTDSTAKCSCAPAHRVLDPVHPSKIIRITCSCSLQTTRSLESSLTASYNLSPHGLSVHLTTPSLILLYTYRTCVRAS